MCWCTPSIRTPWCNRPGCAPNHKRPAEASGLDAMQDWCGAPRPDAVVRWRGSQGPLELLLRVVRAHEERDGASLSGELNRATVELRRQGFLGGVG